MSRPITGSFPALDEPRPALAKAPAPAPKPAANPRRLALNFVLLSAGEFVAKFVTFIAFAYMARSLGPGQYGAIEFTLAVMVFFTLPADLGLGAYGAREIARNPGQARRLFREITHMRLLLAASSFLLLLVFAALIPRSIEAKFLLAIYGLTLLFNPALCQWLFQAHDLMHWVAAASITRQSVFAGLLFLFFRPGRSVLLIGVIELASVAATAGFCFLVARRRLRFPPLSLSFSVRPLLVHFRQGLPIGLTELAWAFMWYFATVILGFVFADDSLGWFGASHRVLMALHTFVWLYFFNLLPSISRCVTLPRVHLDDLMRRSIQFSAWTSIFAAFTVTALAREALTIAYGAQYAGGTGSLEIMAWILPVAMLSGHYRYILVAYNQQNALLWCTMISAGVAVTLGLGLVRLMGGPGAALALLAANVVNFVLVYCAVCKRVGRVSFHLHVLQPLLALALAGLLFFLLYPHNVWWAASLAGAGYAGVLAVSRGRRVLSFLRMVANRDVPAEGNA